MTRSPSSSASATGMSVSGGDIYKLKSNIEHQRDQIKELEGRLKSVLNVGDGSKTPKALFQTTPDRRINSSSTHTPMTSTTKPRIPVFGPIPSTVTTPVSYTPSATRSESQYLARLREATSKPIRVDSGSSRPALFSHKASDFRDQGESVRVVALMNQLEVVKGGLNSMQKEKEKAEEGFVLCRQELELRSSIAEKGRLEAEERVRSLAVELEAAQKALSARVAQSISGSTRTTEENTQREKRHRRIESRLKAAEKDLGEALRTIEEKEHQIEQLHCELGRQGEKENLESKEFAHVYADRAIHAQEKALCMESLLKQRMHEIRLKDSRIRDLEVKVFQLDERLKSESGRGDVKESLVAFESNYSRLEQELHHKNSRISQLEFKAKDASNKLGIIRDAEEKQTSRSDYLCDQLRKEVLVKEFVQKKLQTEQKDSVKLYHTCVYCMCILQKCCKRLQAFSRVAEGKLNGMELDFNSILASDESFDTNSFGRDETGENISLDEAEVNSRAIPDGDLQSTVLNLDSEIRRLRSLLSEYVALTEDGSCAVQ